MHTNLRVENKTIFKILIAISAFYLFANAAYLVREQLIWIATAFFIAIALNPAVEVLQKYLPRKSRGLSVAVVILGLLAVAAFLIATFVPALIEQSTALIASIPKLIEAIRESNTPLSGLIERYDLEKSVQNGINDLARTLVGATGSVLTIARNIFSGFAAFLTIIVLSIFMMLEGPKWNKLAWSYHPPENRVRNQKIGQEMYDAISSYFTGLLVIAAISAVLSSLVMTVVGVPYAIPLGLIVGLFGLIPFVGATLAAILVILVALLQSPTAAIVMTIYFLIYQQVENNIIQPIIQGRSTNLSPLVVTVAIIIGVSIAGLFGALVAIPIAACLKVLLKYYVREHHAGPYQVKTAKKVG